MEFSYICKVCNRNIKSNTEAGERCKIFLLVNGNIVETMSGQYNGFGSVFEKGLKKSYDWEYANWDKLVDIHLNDNPKDGFAAYHEACYRNHRPGTRSENDPNRAMGDFKKEYNESSSHDVYEKTENFQYLDDEDSLNEFFDRQKFLKLKLL